MLIPYSCSFFTRIPHPELLSSLSRISFSSGSRTSVENLLDQHASEALISFVHITCTTYCFRRKGHCCHYPYCFPSQSQTLFAIDATSPVKVKSVKSRIPLTFPESSAVFLGRSLVPGIPFLSPRKKSESTSAYLSAAYPATSG